MDAQLVSSPPKSLDATQNPKLETKLINLALQGGGAHGAFTWGVLDRTLDDDRIGFDGINATSAAQ